MNRIQKFILMKNGYIFFLKNKLFFRAVLGWQQIWAESTERSHTPHAPTYAQNSPIVNVPSHSGTFVRMDEPTLTHHYNSKSIVYIIIAFGVFHSIGLDTNITTCIHHYSSIQNSFTVLKILCALPIHPCLPLILGNNSSFYHSHSFAFSKMLYSWNHIVYSLFKLASFT